jgi:hypothetical protein
MTKLLAPEDSVTRRLLSGVLARKFSTMASGWGSVVGPTELDAPLVRVPFESLKRAAKERKAIVDKMDAAVKALKATAGQSPSKALSSTSGGAGDGAAVAAALAAELGELKVGTGVDRTVTDLSWPMSSSFDVHQQYVPVS